MIEANLGSIRVGKWRCKGLKGFLGFFPSIFCTPRRVFDFYLSSLREKDPSYFIEEKENVSSKELSSRKMILLGITW